MIVHRNTKRVLKVMLGGLSLAAVTASLSVAQDFATMGRGADVSKMCGKKPATVALVDGFGADVWRKTVVEELKDEASKCPNITKVSYSDASGDQQKYNGDINSYVAQGTDIIIAFTDFGDASLPIYRNATQAGATVVAYFAKMNGTAGVDYSANVYHDQSAAGALWGNWLGKTLVGGNVVMLGGPPGALPSINFLAGLKQGMASYPDLKLLDDNYVSTNWNPADAQRATAGLIAKYSKIDAIVTDNGTSVALAAVKAFEQAGLPVPAILTVSSGNALNCKYLADSKTNKKWPYFAIDGTTTIIRFALRRGLSAFEGTQNEEPPALVPYVSADSANGIDPKCDPSVPPDADLSSILPPEKLKTVFN